MSEIPMKKKMELVHQVRSQYHRNQSDLMSREQILYGNRKIGKNAKSTQSNAGIKGNDSIKGNDDRKDNNSIDSNGSVNSVNSINSINSINSKNSIEGIENTLKFRLAIAGILLLLVILFDISEKSFVGISTEQLFQTIGMDYGTMMEQWVETAIYK